MKQTKRIWLALAATAILLVAVGGFFLYSLATRPKTPVIALYRIPAPVAAVLTDKAQDPVYTGGSLFSVMVLDETQPLGPQLETITNRISLLFSPIGQASAALSDEAHRPAERVRRLLPTTIRNAGSSGRDAYALPLLMDHYELAYSKKLFPENRYETPKTVTRMLQMARAVKTKKTWPLICAGSRDEDLLLLTGTLVHSLHGIDSYKSLVAHIRSGEPFETILEETDLKSVLETLLSWRRERLLHPQWLEMTNEDIEAFMRFDSAAFVFMPLSTRRQINAETVEKYDSYRFPADHAATSYPLTAPVYAGIRIRNELFADSAEKFLYSLAEDAAQQSLSRDTGLAPANAKAPVPDKQAYDVRYWAAASQVLVPDPVTAAVDDPARIASFAADIRAYIRSGGKPLSQQ